jgi:large subunit ribosomal protein L13
VIVKTYSIKEQELQHDWYVVDAAGQNLGRLSSKIAAILRGKHKPSFTPWMDNGDFVIVVNADKIEVTGRRLDAKKYYSFSGYPGGLKSITLRGQLDKHPERVLIASIKGMLPHNRLGRKMFKKLKVYASPDHPHAAQQPKPLEL